MLFGASWAFRERLGGVLDGIGSVLVGFGTVLEGLGGVLERVRAGLDRPESVVGACWASLDRLAASRERFGA